MGSDEIQDGTRHMKILYAGEKFENITTGGQRRIAAVMDYLSTSNGNVIYMQTRETPRGFVKRNFLLTNLWYILRIMKMDKSEQAIVIEDYSQRFYLFLFNFSILACRIKKIRLVCLANAFYFSCRRSRLKNIIDQMVSRLFFKPARLIISGGKAAQKELVETGVPGRKIRTVYPALRPEFTRCRHQSGAENPNTVELLFVGRVNPIKGLEYLIDAVALLDERELRLSIVGDTSYLPDYTRRLKNKSRWLGLENRINFAGEITDPIRLIEAYAAADILILPSLWDTSPIAVIEAMCLGLPVIAARVGGIPDWVEDGVTGLLVEPENLHALAKAIARLVRDSGLRQRLGRAGRERSVQFHTRTWEDVGKEYHELLNELSPN